MKNILCLALLALVSAVPFLQASAQEQRATVTVHFDFRVGDTLLPAGSYIITSDSGRRVIDIASADLKHHVNALVMNDSYGNSRANLVVFQKYGNQYFLHRIVRSDVHSGMFLTPSKTEKRVRRQIEMAGIPLEDPILVAINDNAAPLLASESSR